MVKMLREAKAIRIALENLELEARTRLEALLEQDIDCENTEGGK